MADWNVVSNPEFFMLCRTTSHILCAENTSECAIFCSLSTSGFKTDTSLMRIFLSWRLEKRRLFLSWRRPVSYRNQFLYDNGHRHERVKSLNTGFKSQYLWRKNALHLIGLFWEPKMELFSEAASKETCFFYLRKGKLFIQLFWLLSFSVAAKKNTFSVEFLLPWKKITGKKNWKKKLNKKQLLGNAPFC